MHTEIGKIYNHISERNIKLTEKLTENSFINKILKKAIRTRI